MRKNWSAFTLAACAFGVWFTIIFARTTGFTDLIDDPERAFAIFGSFVAATVFGMAVARIVDRDD